MLKIKVAVEFELSIEMSKTIEGCVDYAMEDFCRHLIESANDWHDEEDDGLSLRYLDHAYTTDKRMVFVGFKENDNEDND